MQLGNFHKKSLGQSIASRNHLVGKVVLLIGNDTPVLNTLVIQLAQKGADIALFCRRQSTEALQSLKQQVEALGQRFLLFSEKELTPEQETMNPADHLVKKITSALGRLDIFIDLTSPQDSILLAAHNNATETEGEKSQPDWKMRHAVFAELAQAN